MSFENPFKKQDMSPKEKELRKKIEDGEVKKFVEDLEQKLEANPVTDEDVEKSLEAAKKHHERRPEA